MGNIGRIFVLLLAAHAILSRGTFTVGDLAMFVVFLGVLGFRISISRLIGGDQQDRGLHGGWRSRRRISVLDPGPATAAAASAPGKRVSAAAREHPGAESEPSSCDWKESSTSGSRCSRGSVTVVTGPVGRPLLRRFLGVRKTLERRTGTARLFWIPLPSLPRREPPTRPRKVFRLFSESVRENVLQGVAPSSAKMADRSHTKRGVGEWTSTPWRVGWTRGWPARHPSIRRPDTARRRAACSRDARSYWSWTTCRRRWTLIPRPNCGTVSLIGAGITCLVVSHRPTLLRRAD